MTEPWEQWVGHTIDGKFCLRQYLGGSDHSAVFSTECQKPEPGTAVIKLVPINREEAKLHLSRAESAAKLSHPHLLQVLQVGLCQLSDLCLLYTVMESAQEDLSQVIPQRALSASEAREILVPTLQALAYIHAEGFVHGHLKLTNIVASENRVKISGDSLYRNGDGGISPANDVWSLAMVVVEALTQRRVWPVTLPAPFEEIAQNCLQKNPRQRWTVARISECLNPASVQPQAPRKKSLYYAVPVLAALLVAIVAAPRLFSRRTEPPKLEPPPITVESTQPPKIAAAPAAFRPAAPLPTTTPAPAIASAPPATTGAPPATKEPVTEKAPLTEQSTAGVVQRVLPAVPAKASSTIHGKVRIDVELRVDPSGSVLEARLDPPVPSRYFGDLALQAAQGWKFAPSESGDSPSKWILRFEFVRDGAKVAPERIAQ